MFTEPRDHLSDKLCVFSPMSCAEMYETMQLQFAPLPVPRQMGKGQKGKKKRDTEEEPDSVRFMVRKERE